MNKRLDMLREMMTKRSDDPFVWYAYAMELRNLSRLEEALHAYTEVATRFPTYVPTYLMAAQVSEELENIEEAQIWAKRGIEAAQKASDSHTESELRAFLAEL